MKQESVVKKVILAANANYCEKTNRLNVLQKNSNNRNY